MSDATSVVVIMAQSGADLGFFEMILRHEERTDAAIPIDGLIILNRLRFERDLSIAELSVDTQKPEHATRTAAEKLVHAGLIERRGSVRAQTYALSAAAYRRAG